MVVERHHQPLNVPGHPHNSPVLAESAWCMSKELVNIYNFTMFCILSMATVAVPGMSGFVGTIPKLLGFFE